MDGVLLQQHHCFKISSVVSYQKLHSHIPDVINTPELCGTVPYKSVVGYIFTTAGRIQAGDLSKCFDMRAKRAKKFEILPSNFEKKKWCKIFVKKGV